MNVTVICPINYFKLVPNENDYVHFRINGFVITNHFEDKLRLLGTDIFPTNIGLVNANAILSNYIVYFDGDTTTNALLKDCTDVEEIARTTSNYWANFISRLWFVKDNSCYIYQTFVQDLDSEDGYINIRNEVLGNSEGEFSDASFSYQEVTDCMDISSDFLKFAKVPDNHFASVPTFYDKSTLPPVANYLPHTANRIMRAFTFYNLLRTNNHLIIKITFHIAIYECLFTSGSSEVTHQVSERAALFLGGTGETKKRNYNLFKSAYDIRSNFVHGNKVKGNRSTYLQIAKPLDDLTRQLFNKLRADSDVFLLSEENQKEFNEYFRNLIFVDDPEPSEA